MAKARESRANRASMSGACGGVRRRSVLQAAAALAALPAAVSAQTLARVPGPLAGDPLVLSGRICDAQGVAAAGVRVALWPGQWVQADGDGRFCVETFAPAGSWPWASGAGLERDAAGVWRASAAWRTAEAESLAVRLAD